MGWAILFLVGVGLAVGFAWGASSQENKYKAECDRREKAIRNFAEERRNEFLRLVEQAKELDAVLREGMLKGRNWLASAVAEFVDTRNLEVESWLVEKPHPALSAAKQVASLRQNYRHVVHRLRLLEMQLASYEEYFPFLVDYRDAILDESIDLR